MSAIETEHMAVAEASKEAVVSRASEGVGHQARWSSVAL